MVEIVREILTQLQLDGLDTTGDWMLEEVFSTLLPLQNNFCNDSVDLCHFQYWATMGVLFS